MLFCGEKESVRDKAREGRGESCTERLKVKERSIGERLRGNKI